MLTPTPLPALRDNYIWMLVNDRQKQAVIVDPGSAEVVEKALSQNKLNLHAILITHHHWDHTQGVSELSKKYKPQVIASRLSPLAEITRRVKEGESIDFPQLHLSFTVFEIPGHTLDHVAYYCAPWLFSGDTLFTAGCGRIFEGTVEQLYVSLQRLSHLPENTEIYCGHEYTASNLAFAAHIEPQNSAIRERISAVDQLRAQNLPTVPALLSLEKATNPFLRCAEPGILTTLKKSYPDLEANPLSVFKLLRSSKDNF